MSSTPLSPAGAPPAPAATASIRVSKAPQPGSGPRGKNAPADSSQGMPEKAVTASPAKKISQPGSGPRGKNAPRDSFAG